MVDTNQRPVALLDAANGVHPNTLFCPFCLETPFLAMEAGRDAWSRKTSLAVVDLFCKFISYIKINYLGVLISRSFKIYYKLS